MKVLIEQLFLTTDRLSKSRRIFWLTLSLTFSVLYSLPLLQKAFSSEYVVATDARQYIFWMQRFNDPELFPNDLIADFFQSVTPAGFTTLYYALNHLGIEPLLLSKLLPPILGVVSTLYCFGICMQIFPVPFAGFLSTLLLNQTLWMDARIVDGVPRNFVYPFFLAFLYYFLQRSPLLAAGAIVLLGLFYPQYVFIAAGILILQLFSWNNWRIHRSANRQDYWGCAIGLLAAFCVLLPYALSASEYGPTISLATAKTFPEFSEMGRNRFFVNNFWEYWFFGERSGLISALMPLCLSGIFLPWVLQNKARFPMAGKVTEKVQMLPRLLIASLFMFLAAHAMLFTLYLPSRYTQHTSLILLSLAGAIALTIWGQAIFAGNFQPKAYRKQRRLAIALALVLLMYPVLLNLFGGEFPKNHYKVARVPSLHQFFQQQPKDILIASLDDEVNKIPTFAQRSIFLGRKYSVPYQIGYYEQIRERAIALIHAQYTPNLKELQSFIETYNIDFWLLKPADFLPDYLETKDWQWIAQYEPAATTAKTILESGEVPALAQMIEPCSVFNADKWNILETACILQMNL